MNSINFNSENFKISNIINALEFTDYYNTKMFDKNNL